MKPETHKLKQELHAFVREEGTFYDLLEGSLDGLWVWDLENPGHCWMSPRFWTLLGYDPLEKKQNGAGWQNLVHPDDLEDLQSHATASGTEGDQPAECVLRFCHKDESTVWVRCRTIIVRNEAGRPIRMMGAQTDLTALKRVEEGLRHHQRFLSAVLDAIQDGISVLDEELRIVGVNQTMNKWYRHALPLEGKKCHEAYHGRSNPCDTCPTLRAMQTGRLERNEMPLTDGARIKGYLELFAFPMESESGDVYGVVEYVRDITDSRQARELLREREELYRSLFEMNKTVMLLIDPDSGAIVDANRSACQYYGYDKSALVGRNIADINILSAEEIFSEMGRAKAERRNYFNFRHRLADGAVRDVEVFSGPVTVGGKPLLCSIIHDISERKTIEREREQLIAKLRKALKEVKTLRGFLPICASCKKVRDDRGYWNQIETYLRDHSEAEFSHSICPECARRLYPDLD